MRGFGLFLVYFFVELGLFVMFAHHFGFLSLVGEILLSGVVGVFLLMNTFGGGNDEIIEFFRGMKTPQELIASNLTRSLGAVLLILPGLLSDGVGILLCIGLFDTFLVSLLNKVFKSKSHSQEGEIIDVEFIEEEDKNEKNHHWK